MLDYMDLHQKSWKIQPLSMNSHVDNVDPILQKVKENEKKSKNAILFHGVLLCVLVSRKNDKLGI